MKLTYKHFKDEGYLVLTNFNCAPSQQLLKDKDLYKILWYRGSGMEVTIDGYKVTLEQNQVLFCTPVNILNIPREEGLLAIVFNREFYCIREHDKEVSCNGLLFFGSSEPPIISLSAKEVESFESLFTVFKEEFETRDHIQGEMLRVLLKRLLIKSTRLVKTTFSDATISNTQLDIVRQYHILVEQYYKEKHQVSSYAELLFKSPKTLANLFKKTGNKSPLKVINERLALEARRLLLHSNMTVEQIGYELGYSEPAHFSKFIKKQLGLSPASYRKEQLAHLKTKGPL